MVMRNFPGKSVWAGRQHKDESVRTKVRALSAFVIGMLRAYQVQSGPKWSFNAIHYETRSTKKLGPSGLSSQYEMKKFNFWLDHEPLSETPVLLWDIRGRFRLSFATNIVLSSGIFFFSEAVSNRK